MTATSWHVNAVQHLDKAEDVEGLKERPATVTLSLATPRH
jgi:hypothetical protein